MKRMIAAKECDLQAIGMDIAEVLVRAGLAKTKSEARRNIEQGAARLEGITIADAFARLAWDGSQFILVEKGN